MKLCTMKILLFEQRQIFYDDFDRLKKLLHFLAHATGINVSSFCQQNFISYA